MAIDPESFDEPVVDYDFAKISTPRSLIDQMSRCRRIHSDKTGLRKGYSQANES